MNLILDMRTILTEDGNLWLVGGLGPNWMFDGFTTEIIGEH